MLDLDSMMFGSGIKIEVKLEDYYDFLVWAKENGCLWSSGEIIHPTLDKDKPYKPHPVAVIGKDRLLHYPYNWAILSYSKNPTYYFKDIMQDIEKRICEDEELEHEKFTLKNSDISNEEKIKLRKSIADKEKAFEEEKIMFNKHLDYLRDLNQKQLIYQKYTYRLPKWFLVKYEDIAEITDIYDVLEKYGYENKYNIKPVYMYLKPHTLFVDNRSMCFGPLDSIDFAHARQSKMKFYNTKKFIKMIENIFNQKREENKFF